MHIERLPSGSHRVVVRVDGRRRTATRPTRAEAERAGAELLLGAAPTVTVRRIVEHHLAANADRWSPTYADDLGRVAVALVERIGDWDATTLSPGRLSELWRAMLVDGWTVHRVRRAHEALAGAYRTAVDDRLLASNPIVGARRPTRPERRVVPPDSALVARALAAAVGVDAVAFRLAAVTGCRRGEIVGLQWDDFDVRHGTIRIVRSLAWSPVAGLHERPTKTGRKGHRTIALDVASIGMLVRHRNGQDGDAVWIISDRGDRPWRPDRLSDAWSTLRRSAGLPASMRLHDLRHHLASTELAAGTPLVEVAQMLGHASPATTAGVYSHWLGPAGAGSAERRAARLAAPR